MQKEKKNRIAEVELTWRRSLSSSAAPLSSPSGPWSVRSSASSLHPLLDVKESQRESSEEIAVRQHTYSLTRLVPSATLPYVDAAWSSSCPGEHGAAGTLLAPETARTAEV